MPTLRPQTEREQDALDNAAALTRELHAWQAYALRLRCEREELRRTLTPTPRPMPKTVSVQDSARLYVLAHELECLTRWTSRAADLCDPDADLKASSRIAGPRMASDAIARLRMLAAQYADLEGLDPRPVE